MGLNADTHRPHKVLCQVWENSLNLGSISKGHCRQSHVFEYRTLMMFLVKSPFLPQSRKLRLQVQHQETLRNRRVEITIL